MIWRYGRSAFVIVLIGFVAFSVLRRLASNYDELGGSGFIAGWRGAIALLSFTIAVLISGVLWRETVESCARRDIPLRNAVENNTAAWLLKYVPGQVGAVAWKIRWGPSVGLTRSQALVAFVYENLYLGTASTVPMIPILFIGFGAGVASLGWYLVAGIAVAIGFAVLSRTAVLKWLVVTLIRMTRRNVDPENLGFIAFGDSIRLQALYTVPRIVNGIGFVALVAAVHPVSPSDTVVLTAAYALAGVLGILAIFVPSGIGVREGVIILVCSRMMPVEVAAVVAINARIWATIADGVLGVGYLVSRERKQTAT